MDAIPARRDTPLQRRWRALRPWPVGCVFVQRPDEDLAAIRGHFAAMRRLGFTCLKQICLCPGTERRAVQHAAIDAGLSPWWHDDAGDPEPVPDLLARLGIPADIAITDLRRHPAWLAHVVADRRRRVDHPEPRRALVAVAAGEVPGMPEPWEPGLGDAAGPAFAAWLRGRYGSVEALRAAWNCGHMDIDDPGWTTWDEVAAGAPAAVRGMVREYRRIMDCLRFRADARIAEIRAAAAGASAPQRAGGEMSLFLPAAMWGVDFAGIADAMADHGSFYISLHPAWHFEETAFELVRSSLIQAHLAAGYARGVWTGLWECVGGPMALSGGKAPYCDDARPRMPGVTVDAGVMTQLMLGWIGAGIRGTGQWCWTPRTAGWEAGEFALCERDGTPGERAAAAGAIGAAAHRLRDELWAAERRPLVAVLADVDHDAVWAAASVAGRDHFRDQPAIARIGAGRVLLDGNVPFAYATARDFREGVMDGCPVWWLPACLGLDEALLAACERHVRAGGRVVLDAPGGWYDLGGRLLATGPGSPFHRLFGCRIADIHYGRGDGRPWTLDGTRLEGFALELRPDPAVAVRTFAEGSAALCEHRLGAGSAVVMAWDGARQAHRPGNPWQVATRAAVLGAHRPDFSAEGCLALRLHAPDAEHLLLINDGPARTVALDVHGRCTGPAADAVTDGRVDPTAVALPAHGARWVRWTR
jgi:beta-galactosidase